MAAYKTIIKLALDRYSERDKITNNLMKLERKRERTCQT
jgi:hypothetical protein